MPTFLIYIALSTSDEAPWRPDAVISTTESENVKRSWDFQGPSRAHADGANHAALSRPAHPIAGQADSRVGQKGVSEKIQLSPGLSPMSPVTLASPLKHPRPGGAGILTRFPFDSGDPKVALPNGLLLSLRID